MSDKNRMWDAYIDFLHCGPEAQLFERWDMPPTRKRRRHKVPNLASAIKRAKAMGMDVTVAPDGSMTFGVCAHNAPEPTNELDQWMTKHAH